MYNDDAFKFIFEQFRKSMQPNLEALYKASMPDISATLSASIRASTPDISATLRSSMPDISAILRSSMPDISTLTPSLKIANQVNLISQSAIKGIDAEIMKSLSDSLTLQRAEIFKSISGLDLGALSVATARRMAQQESEGEIAEEDANAAVEFGEDTSPGWSDRIRGLAGDAKDRTVELLPAAAAIVLWVLMTFILLFIVGAINGTEAVATMRIIFAGLLEGEAIKHIAKGLKASGEAVKDNDKDTDEIQ